MSAADSLPIFDADAREAALDPTLSFVVQAPAGSGKTELLVRRFLTVLTGVSRPEEVLAVTFTRKAAGEMRERIISELRAGAQPTPPESAHEREGWELARKVLERSNEQGWNLTENPTRLRVSTIDSLAGSIVSAIPLLSRSGDSPTVQEDSQPLLAEAVRRTLTSRDPELRAAVNLLAERTQLRLDRLSEQLIEMLGRREQWAKGVADGRDDSEGLLARIEASFAEVIAEELDAARPILGDEFMTKLEQVADHTRPNFEDPEKPCPWPTLGVMARLSDPAAGAVVWREARALALTGAKTLRKKFDKNAGAAPKSEAKAVAQEWIDYWQSLDGDRAAQIETTLVAAARLPVDSDFSAEGAEALSALFTLLLDAFGQLTLVFSERTAVDYSEVGLRAIAGLGRSDDPSELLLLLDRTLKHILVDEFQDTNFLQGTLMALLTSGWEEKKDRTLFLVGDPMQSIYRFRRAEVGLFIEARAGRGGFQHVNPRPLSLSVSFRSTRSILEWVNNVFGPLLGDEEDARRGIVAYSDFQPAPAAEQGPAVELHRWQGAPLNDVPGDDNDGQDDAEAAVSREPASESEARGLALLIRDALEESPDADIAVLLRTSKQGRPLMRALASLAVPYNAAGVEELGDRSTVRDLNALVRTLLHPGDRLAGAALLRSPMVGLSIADLNVLFEAAAETSGKRRRFPTLATLLADAKIVAALSSSGAQRANRLHEVLNNSRRWLGRRPASFVARGAWVALGGPVVVAAAGGAELADVDRYLTALDASCRGGLPDLDALDRALGKLKSSPSSDPEVRVVFLTMHAAKGLEFDTVILPRLEGKGATDKKAALALEADPQTLDLRLVAPQPLARGDSPDLGKYELIVAREKARGEAELMRLFYVAATRAKRRLVLSACVKETKDGFAKPQAGSLLSAGWSVLKSHFDEVKPKEGLCLPAAKAPVGRQLPETFEWAAYPPGVEIDDVTRRRPSQPDKDTLEDQASGAQSYGPSVEESADGDREGSSQSPTSAGKPAIPAAMGRVIHAQLERIVLETVAAWPAERVALEVPRFRRLLRQEGVPEAELDAAAGTVTDAIQSTLADEDGLALLTETEESRVEWSLVHRQGANLTTAIVDRSFVRDGKRWIVDYKTAQPPAAVAESDEATLLEWIEHECQRYAEQMNSYRAVVAAAQDALSDLTSGLELQAALYFTSLPPGRRLRLL